MDDFEGKGQARQLQGWVLSPEERGSLKLVLQYEPGSDPAGDHAGLVQLLLPPRQNLSDKRKRGPHGFRASGDSFVNARKISPVHMANFRFEDYIRVARPGRLQRGSMRCPVFQIKNFHGIFRRPRNVFLGPYVNSQHTSIVVSRGNGRWHRRHDATVGQ